MAPKCDTEIKVVYKLAVAFVFKVPDAYLLCLGIYMKVT